MRRTEPIVSPHNPRIKAWAQLLGKKGRDRQQAYLIEGIHLVQEALRWQAGVTTVLYSLERGLPSEIAELLAAGGGEREQQLECVPVSEQVLAKCSDTETPQPVLAVIAKRPHAAESLLAVPNGLVVVADGIQDPGNLGTIIRSADAVGASGVVLGKGTVDLYNPKTVRSTMGSLFHIPVVEAELPPLLAKAAAAGIRLYGTSLQATQSCYACDFTGASWIVLGNEGSGLSAETAAQIGEPIIIPMPGAAESLNVAMAATVLLFEAMRQRGLNK